MINVYDNGFDTNTTIDVEFDMDHVKAAVLGLHSRSASSSGKGEVVYCERYVWDGDDHMDILIRDTQVQGTYFCHYTVMKVNS